MSSSIFDWFRSRTRRRRREEREEDVRDTLYQHRNVELFPKDLNKDYNGEVMKTHSANPATFQSPWWGPSIWTASSCAESPSA